MIRLIAVAFALAVATSAQAMSPAPLHQADGMITQVREACGAGRVRINGVCVARTTKRQVRRCARWSGGACVRYYCELNNRECRCFNPGNRERRKESAQKECPRLEPSGFYGKGDPLAARASALAGALSLSAQLCLQSAKHIAGSQHQKAD